MHIFFKLKIYEAIFHRMKRTVRKIKRETEKERNIEWEKEMSKRSKFIARQTGKPNCAHSTVWHCKSRVWLMIVYGYCIFGPPAPHTKQNNVKISMMQFFCFSYISIHYFVKNIQWKEIALCRRFSFCCQRDNKWKTM